ncbi:MAG: hypothetical protein EOP88_01310 [Verrucomicrobiaceae bacterium]|nr:MAG: hypothetical protein EOP88_01310 [Verrucomicrobiaceae bacterium]
MNRKLLFSGFCLISGICLLLVQRSKEPSAVMSAGRNPGPHTRHHPSSQPLSRTSEVRSPGDGRRSALIREIDAILSSGEPIDSERFSSLLVQLAAIDPTAAARHAEALASGPLRQEALQKLSQAWACKDPADAETWAAGLADESERQSALENICLQVGQENAERAVKVAEKHQLGNNPGPVMETLVQQWAGHDFPAAVAWVKSKPAGERREQMIMRLAIVQAATLPSEAGRLVVEEIPEGPVQTEAVISVIHQWGLRDMAGARDWVGLFPEGPLRERAEAELTGMASFAPGQEGQSD